MAARSVVVPWQRGSTLVAAVALLAAIVATVWLPPSRSFARQDDPPAAAGGREVLLQATLERRTDDPLSLLLLRITLEPGALSPLHAHPGLEFGVVEAGTLVVRVGGRAVLRPADAAADEPSETLPVDEEVTLGPGDRIAYAPGTPLTFRNPGPERTTLLAATILPAGPDAPPGAVYADGPPGAEEVAGVRSRILGEAIAPSVPVGRGAATLERFVLEAGAAVPAYAGPVLVAVERGALSGSVLGGDVELPAGTPAAVPAATPLPNDGGADFSLVAGQSLFFPEGMAETPPLGGEGRVVLLRLGILPLPDAPATPVAAETEASAAGERDAETATAEVEADDEEPEPTTTESETTEGAADDAAAEAATEEADQEAPPTAAVAGGALPVGTRVVVAVEVARLRAGPSLSADVLLDLEQGRVLVVAGAPISDDDLAWYPVRDLRDATVSGFVAADLVVPRE